jgi:polyhydroxybutyrate depolymerase
MKYFVVTLYLVLSLNWPNCQVNVEGNITFQNCVRTFIVHLPPGHTKTRQYPLVFVLHGGTGNSKQIMEYTGVNSVADTADFIVCYPQGFQDCWADARGVTEASLSGIDDVGFFSALIDSMIIWYNVHPYKVFSSGISNGGFMTQTLLCHLPEKIAAGCVVAAGAIDSVLGFCKGACKKPVIFIHGTDDNYVPFNGGQVVDGRGYCMSADSSLFQASVLNRCAGPLQEESLPNINRRDRSTVTKKFYMNCSGQNEVLLYQINNGGHTWPGANTGIFSSLVLGPTNQDINAGVVAWNFFKTKHLSGCRHHIHSNNKCPIAIER